MTTVEVRTLSYIREFIGKKAFPFSFDGEMTVYELVEKLDEEYQIGQFVYNEDRTISDNVRIILRGRDAAFLEESQLVLKDGDIVLVMPVLCGG